MAVLSDIEHTSFLSTQESQVLFFKMTPLTRDEWPFSFFFVFVARIGTEIATISTMVSTKRRGFTLVQLLIVVAVIEPLAAGDNGWCDSENAASSDGDLERQGP